MFDLLLELIQRFVRKFEVFGNQTQLNRRPALYLANHQTFLEGFLFNSMASAYFEVPIRTIIKTGHRFGWVGLLNAFAKREPGTRRAEAYYYFDQADPRSLFSILDEFISLQAQEPHSLIVFVEGHRARSAKERVSRISSVLPDFAVRTGIPIVPLRISGGLPLAPLTEKADFPFAFGQQDYVLGTPIEARILAPCPGRQGGSGLSRRSMICLPVRPKRRCLAAVTLSNAFEREQRKSAPTASIASPESRPH